MIVYFTSDQAVLYATPEYKFFENQLTIDANKYYDESKEKNVTYSAIKNGVWFIW